MEKRTIGTVISVQQQWWLKVNINPVRIGTRDGAVFPHIVKVVYNVGDREIIRRKWIPAGVTPLFAGSTVTVIYRDDKPEKCRLEI